MYLELQSYLQEGEDEMNGDEFMTKIIVRKIKYSWIVKVILQFF